MTSNVKNSTYSLSPEKWVDNYSDYLYRYTITRINCSEIAKDLVQETFMAGLNGAQRYKGKAHERSWLVSILKRKIVDHYRRCNSNKVKSIINVSDMAINDNQTRWLEEFVPDPYSERQNNRLENIELRSVIDDCVNKLPKRYAKAFIMKTIRGYSTEVVCDALRVSKSNLWVMLHRSRKALMLCLSEHWYMKKSA